MSSEALKAYVHPGDVIAAVRTLHHPRATLLDYQVLKATENVQGFMSCILRVCATSQAQGESEPREVRFVVKRLPLLEQHQALARNMHIFDLEVAFFTHCLPIMRRRCPELKVVDCLFAHSNDTIVLEDLGLKGFHTIASNFEEIKEQRLTLGMARLVMRELAKFHASAYGINWAETMPALFEKDVVFELNGGEAFKGMVKGGLETGAIPIMELMFKDEPDYIKKYTDWLNDMEGNITPLFLKLVKPNPKYLTSLCHGDCWQNNFMIRTDPESGEPIDLCFIDLQIARYAPVYLDLLYFLYLSTKRAFRTAHVPELVRTYVHAFNAAVSATPDPVDLNTFMSHFDELRVAGVLIGMSLCPLGFAGDVAPADGEELSEQNIQNLLGSGGDAQQKKQRVVKVFQEDPMFKSDMENYITEFIELMDKHIFKSL